MTHHNHNLRVSFWLILLVSCGTDDVDRRACLFVRGPLTCVRSVYNAKDNHVERDNVIWTLVLFYSSA